MTISTTPSDCSETLELPNFDVLPLSSELRKAIDELGYTHPTPVQRAVYEPASRGLDLVVQARTGTGKTASFGLPLIDVLVRRNQIATQALILCPTRELAVQVHRELERLGKYRGLSIVAIYGGAPMSRQFEALRAGAQIVVGTPGRVLDHLQRESLSPSNIRVCILDESDEMLSMGFLPQITEILGYLPSPHQTLLFSATLPVDIQRMAESRLNEPVFLTLSGDNIGALDVQHLTYFSIHDKLDDLLRVLEVEDPESAIIFCNTKDETKRVAAALDKRGFSAEWLNADLAQSDREKVMEATRKSNLRFLVCTDVASRGIDISHLTHVINFDFPESPEAYVHRTGRTGRAGRTGTAISLITPGDIGFLYILRLTYKIVPIQRQLPTKAELRTRGELDLVEMFVEAFKTRAPLEDDIMLARRLMSHESAEFVVAGLLRDHLGSRPESNSTATDNRRSRLPTRVADDSFPAKTGAALNRTVSKVQPPALSKVQPPAVSQVQPPAVSQVQPPAVSQVQPPALSKVQPPAASKVQPLMAVADVTQRAEGPGSPDADVQPIQVGAGRRKRRQDLSAQEPTLRAIPDSLEEEFDFRFTVGEPAERGNREEIEPPVGGQSQPRKMGRTDSARANADAPVGPPEAGSEVFVNIGRRDGVNTEDVLALLAQRAIPKSAILHVSVRHHHTFVGVKRPNFHTVLGALDGASLAGHVARAEPARSNRD